jgi:hypothetical protein
MTVAGFERFMLDLLASPAWDLAVEINYALTKMDIEADGNPDAANFLKLMEVIANKQVSVDERLAEMQKYTSKPGYGAQVNAAMRAGFFTSKTTAMNRARIASRLHRDERIQAALVEEGRKIVRGCAPDAAKAVLELVRDKDHKDHARALAMVLDRVDPMVMRTDMNVVHKIIDPDIEGLEELRALRALHTPHAKMLEVFGVNGLDRLLALERRSDAAKVIEGETIEGPPAGP